MHEKSALQISIRYIFIGRCIIDSIRERKDRFIKYIFTNHFSMSENKSGLSFLAFFCTGVFLLMCK